MQYKDVNEEESTLVLYSPTVDALITSLSDPTYDFYKVAMSNKMPGNRSTSQKFFNDYITMTQDEVENFLRSLDWRGVVFQCDDDYENDRAEEVRSHFLPTFINYIRTQRTRPDLIALVKSEEDDSQSDSDIEDSPEHEGKKTHLSPGQQSYFDKIKAAREKQTDQSPIAVHLRQERHGATLAAMMTTPVVYQSLIRDIKAVGALTAEVKNAIDAVCHLPSEYRELVVKIMGFYGLSNSVGGPQTTYIEDSEHQLYVSPKQKLAFEKELLGAAVDIPAKSFKKFYQQPPGIHDAAKHAATNDRDTDNPIGRTFPDPNGMLKPLIAMRSANVVSASKSNIYYNVKAKQSAFTCCIVDMGSDNYGPSMSDEDKDRVYDKNIYVDPIAEPHPIMTRYTPAPVADEEYTSTASKAFEGFRWHSQRYDNKIADPRSKTDIAVNSQYNFVPQNSLGGDRASTYLAVRATEKGRRYVTAVENELASHTYKPASASSYENYHMFYLAAVHGEQLTPEQSDIRDQYAASPAKVTKWWEDVIFPDLLKVFASHLGFMSVIGLELSIAGVPQIPGLLILSELGALNKRVACIAGHELVDKFNAPICATDGYAGQSQIGGEFRPIDPKYFKTDKMDIINLGNSEDKDDNYNTLVPHKRYARRSALALNERVQVLIDFTIPGLYYCPQNVDKANDTTKKFKGQKILVDDAHTVGLYEPKDLARYQAFMVYFPLSVFTENKLVNQFKVLATTHKFSISPAPVLCLMGMYVVGWKNDVIKPVEGIRGMNLTQLRHNMLVHIVAKTSLLMEHFNGYPSNPYLIYTNLTNYTSKFPSAHKSMRLGIGSLKSYKEYAKRTKDPNAKDTKFAPDKEFAEYMKKLDAVNESILDDPILRQWGKKYINDVEPTY